MSVCSTMGHFHASANSRRWRAACWLVVRLLSINACLTRHNISILSAGISVKFGTKFIMLVGIAEKVFKVKRQGHSDTKCTFAVRQQTHNQPAAALHLLLLAGARKCRMALQGCIIFCRGGVHLDCMQVMLTSYFRYHFLMFSGVAFGVG